MTVRVLIHEDDVGMCHGANVAFRELSATGFLDGGSIMVPCPWFKEVTAIAADPSLDLGVHLTLNSEKEHYKWRPLTAPAATAGLTDGDGFMWPTVAELRAHCEPEAAEAEMRAQIDAALASGIDVTHADAHMFAALAPEFCESYLQIALDYQIPLMLTEQFDGESMPRHLNGVDEGPYREVLRRARKLGLTVFDGLIETVWDRTDSAEATCRRMFAASRGLTYMALHPTAPGELEAIEPGTAHIRYGEYVTFSDPEFTSWLGSLGVERVTWRSLRDELRGTSS